MRIAEPAEGELASGLTGKGRMAEPAEIAAYVGTLLAAENPEKKKHLSGKRFVVTAGATIEAIDPVRFISNHSSGKMGYAIAGALAARGAQVTLVTGRTSLPTPPGVERVDVLSAAEMYDAATGAFDGADGAVMCAAVADYTPDAVSQTKLKKGEGEMHITLRRTRDIAAELGAAKGGRLLVGFALETHDEQANAEAKLARKNFDFIVLNSLRDAGAGFRGDTNKVTFIDRNGREPLPLMPKSEVAGRITVKIKTAMLRRLSVENYVLIDKLEMELDPHLNIITGETGAGKSILLGALGLLLGAKNDGSAMKDAARNCVVEGTFDLSGRDMEAFFAGNDLDYAPETTVTRMITPAGKSRAFINDLPVQLAQLREFGTRLIDIHSQHQNLILSSEEFRTSALDTVAGNGELLAQYAAQYTRLTELRRRLAALREAAAGGRRDEEWLCFQSEELTAANLREGEQAAIEEELAVLENADRIGEVLTTLRNALDADETGMLTLLKNSENDLTRIREHFPAAGEYAARLHSVLEELKDIDNAAAADSERLDADPERLAKLAARLDALYALQQKHRVASETELIAARDSYAAQLAAIVHGDEEIAAAEKELDAAAQKAGALADRLHKARAKAAPAFEKQILATLAQLGMPETVFRVALTPLPDLGRTGGDGVAFLFSANRNATPQSVERIASGGELSRVMLALKSLLARRMQLPTVIFDEIDTGVSGRIADAMGEIIESLSATLQVVDITHLPQVASKGAAHFVVYKRDGRTGIARLTDEERITEIAKMLSGSRITDAAIAQARILLGK